MSATDTIKRVFREVLESPEFSLEAVERHFDPDYRQKVDGKELNYQEFVAHLREQRKTLKSAKVTILASAETGDTVFTHHEVDVAKTNGHRAQFKVMAQFTVRDGRVLACDELTHMLDGSSEDRDLGSRH